MCGLREEYIVLLCMFALSTWFIEQLPVSHYIALVGFPRPGKSTALSELRLLHRRRFQDRYNIGSVLWSLRATQTGSSDR
jgi:hypothetical protein